MEKYLAHLEDGRAFILAEGINMRLYSGCEVLYTDASARLAQEGQFPTLAGSDLVLVEFSPDASFRRLCDAASSFGMAGYSVLFAHVERYEALRNLKNVQKLRNEFGVHMQMNTNTIIGKKGFFTEHWVRHMLEDGHIDCVATDAHNLSYRPCKMKQCHEMLAMKYGSDFADELCSGFQRRLLEI
jgi:protein-tyrosine phosphatase